MNIESRIQEFMGLHKGDLSRFLAKAEAKLIELGHDVEAIFADDPAPAPVADEPALVADDTAELDEHAAHRNADAEDNGETPAQ